MRKILLGCLFSFAISCFAHTDRLIVDQYLSPYAGAAINLSAYNLYMYLDDCFLPSTEDKQGLPWFMVRTGKLGLDYVLSSILMVTQHEIFGHGYRLREYGFSDISYTINIRTGSTGFSLEDFLEQPPTVQIAIAAAGMEANTIFAQEIRRKWIKKGQIDSRESMLYFVTTFDQADYILSTSDSSTNAGNDVNAYVNGVNDWYNSDYLSKRKLRRYALWDFVDPTLFAGMYSMGKYLMYGSLHMNMPMLDTKYFKYTFCTRLLLAPYGPEVQLQNYLFRYNQQLWQINLRYGNNSGSQSYGLDVWTNPVWCYQNWDFSNKFFIWQQPDFLTDIPSVSLSNKMGIANLVRADYNVSQNFSVFGELGYKTAGYIQGLPLSNSWVWRLGLSFK